MPEQPLEVPSDHRGGSRGRPRHHRSAPRTLDEALRLPGRLRARENGVYWRRKGRDRGQKGVAHCGPVPGVDPRGGSTAQGRAPALRKTAPWMIERARTGYVVATKLKCLCLRKVDMSYDLRLIRPGCLAWATSGSLCRV